MAAWNSTQYALYASSPPRLLVPGRDWVARVLRFWFDFLSTATVAIADTINLVTLPAGSRVMGGSIAQDVATASVTVSIGYAGATARYLSASSWASAGVVAIANTIALNIGELLTADTPIFLTTAGASFVTGKNVKGYVEVTVD